MTAADMGAATRTGLALGVLRSAAGAQPQHGAAPGGPLIVGQVLLLASRRGLGSTPLSGPTLLSIRQGRSAEIDHLGDIVVSQPVLPAAPPSAGALTELVHEVGRTAHFLAAAELVDRDPRVSGRSPRPPPV